MPDMSGKSAEQIAAEDEVNRFKRELGPFVVAAETTRMAMLFTDASRSNNPIIFVNDSFLDLTGYNREDVLGKSFNFLLEEEGDTEAARQIALEFAGRSKGATEVFYHRKKGPPFWVAIFASPVRDASGKVVQHFTSFIDLSVQKEERARLGMLIDELNHRVKNTLATVRSIVSQGLRSSIDLDEVKAAIEARLFALSSSHDLLSRESWHSAGLHDLVQEATRPFSAAADGRERFVVTGDDVRLPPNRTLAIGIALHELATNAVKYGALSNDLGQVRISWETALSESTNRLLIRWEETGGPTVTQPLRRGFGTRVIERGLTHELGAATALEYRPAGLLCTIDMPVAADGPHSTELELQRSPNES